LIAADRGDNGLSGEPLTEVYDAVVVPDDLDVAITVRVVESQQLPPCPGAECLGMPGLEPWRTLGDQTQKPVQPKPEQRQGNQEVRERDERTQTRSRSRFEKPRLPRTIGAKQGIRPALPGSRCAQLLVHRREQLVLPDRAARQAFRDQRQQEPPHAEEAT